MNRKKLFITSLPLILIVIALVAGFVFFPQSFDLRNKASVGSIGVAPRPEGTAQMLMLQEVTKDTDVNQSFDMYFNGAYKPDAQVSSFETQITVRSQNGQVLGDSIALEVPQESIMPSYTPTPMVTRTMIDTSLSKISCDPQNPSGCGYGSKCVASGTAYNVNTIQTAPSQVAPNGYFCSVPTYCFNTVTTQSGKLSWNGCKGPNTGGACVAAFIPLTETEISLYNSWVSQGRPSNQQCGADAVSPTTSLMPSITPILDQITIWTDGNAKLVTTADIQSKFDLVVTSTKAPDGMSYIVSVKGTPKVGASILGQNLKFATLVYDTQRFTRKVSAEITKRSIIASTSQSSTPTELITTPTAINKGTITNAPTTTPTCTLASVQPIPNGTCSAQMFTAALATCTNGQSTTIKSGVCTDYAQLKSMAYNYCQSTCARPSVSITPPRPTTSSSPTPISMTPPSGIRCMGQCIISGDGRADPYGTTYPVGRSCYGIDRQCYVCNSNGQFAVSKTACSTIPTPNPTTNIASVCVGQCKGDQPGTSYSTGKTCIGMDDLCYTCGSNGQWSSGPASTCGGDTVTPTVIATVTPTAVPTACPTAPKCDGILIHGDPRPGSGMTCPVYQCMPTPTPACPPWNLLCKIVSTPTPTPSAVTPTPCPPAPKCNGQLAVGDPQPGSNLRCPVYQCMPTPTPTPTCAAWNLFCRIRPSVTPTSYACPQNYSPVCGVNGKTYGNSCLAGQAKIAIAYTGACGSKPTPTPSPCPWWNLGCRIRPSVTPTPSKTPTPTPWPNVTRAGGDSSGVVCTSLYAPVCSSDNVTYSNECEANKAGATIAYNGACNAVPAQQ